MLAGRGRTRGTVWTQGWSREIRRIHGVRERDSSEWRLVPAIRVQSLLDPFEASITIAAMNCGPSIEFSRDEIPSAANLLPHFEKDPILFLGPRGLSNARVEFFTEPLRGLIIGSTRKVFCNLMPTVAMFANGLQE